MSVVEPKRALPPLPDRASRRAAGREQREAVPFDALARVPAPDERGDPIALLVAQDERRVPELVPIRHGRMRATPFTFYRGAAAIMAADLARTPRTELGVQLCGDAHLSNFGLFHGPDRRLIFDLNDFDETLPGPFDWDLKRLAASVMVAARTSGLTASEASAATRSSVRGYREMVAQAADLPPLALHYHRIEIDAVEASLERGEARKTVERAARKASKKNSLRALQKLTRVVDGRRQIVDDPPLVIRLPHLFEGAEWESSVDFFFRYLQTLPLHRRRVLEQYRIVDLAHKIVGVGSVGTRCLIVLLESADGDPLFMQFKEATRSVLEDHLPASSFEEAGERVVQGQRLMQAAGDVFLGWSRHHRPDGTDTDYYFRQLWDGKGSAEVEAMGAKALRRYARACGATLALAHARSGDATSISAYVGDDDAIDEALAAFAAGYADLDERDHAAHGAAIAAGRITAVDDL